MMRYLDKSLAIFLSILMVVLVISVSWQVLSRYLLSVPASWTEELARFLLIWISMLGAAYAYRMGSHIGFDYLVSRTTGQKARRLNQFSHLVCLVFAVAVLVIGGGALMQMTWELRQYSAAMGLPIAVVYSVIPLSGILIAIFSLVEIVDPHEDAGISSADGGQI